jgi:hypothetical protein
MPFANVCIGFSQICNLVEQNNLEVKAFEDYNMVVVYLLGGEGLSTHYPFQFSDFLHYFSPDFP